MYWLVTVLAGLLLATGILMLQSVFFALAINTVSLLDMMLDTELEDSDMQSGLITRLAKLLGSLFLFFLSIVAIIAISFLPLLIYAGFNFEAATTGFTGWPFWLVFSLATIIPFVVVSIVSKKQDYSSLSKLLHRLLLDNYNVSRSLFKWEKRKAKKIETDERFVVISGLARCGTTALTTKLHDSGNFYSLSYANTPFLMAPNLWRKFYNPGNTKTHERAHGDKVEVGLNSVEALEEFFYKAFLKDAYIGQSVRGHEVSDDLYQNYLDYQKVVKRSNKGEGKMYLAKNNNFLLRYASLREKNEKFISLFLFREPLNHAWSLLKQHKRFSQMQTDDPFVLDYMNWLGHHEFGLAHKRFRFTTEETSSSYTPNDINYWLEVWVHYYSQLLSLKEHQNTFYVEYADFLNSPYLLMEKLSQVTGIDLSAVDVDDFRNTNSFEGDCDENLYQKANDIYFALQKRKLKLDSIRSSES